MAEGWARWLLSDEIEAHSAGTQPQSLNPLAVAVMAEAGVDISDQRAKSTRELGDTEFDYVVTVCGHAHETCPAFPANTRVLHVGFDDPPRLAADTTSREEALPHYRRVRDEIRAFVEQLTSTLAMSVGEPH